MSECLDDDMMECCGCHGRFPCEEVQNHGEDFDLCRKCSAAFCAEVSGCVHDWEPDRVFDDLGEEGRVCRRCMVFVDRDAAMSWFPLVCDGYVAVPEA